MKSNSIAHGTPKSYVLGFFLSLLLTLSAYFVVANHLFSRSVLVSIIVGLGLMQALVQLVLFLHLGQETKPHWNMLVFLFMLLIVVILVFGSLWIMAQLNYRVMPTMDRLHQEGI